MRKFLAGTVLALAVCASIGTGTAIAATDFPRTTAEDGARIDVTAHVYKAGYFLPYGGYVVTCHRVIVGYTWHGWPIVRSVCG
jgi:hypothetical protein